MNFMVDNQEDVFRFIKAKDKEIWETYILISSYPVLKNSTQLIKMVYSEVAALVLRGYRFTT